MPIGRNGSIKRCIVKNSPGAVVSDAATAIGKSGAIIVDGEEAASEVATTQAVKLLATRPVAKRPRGRRSWRRWWRRMETVQVSLAGDMGDEVAYVTFEAADRFDYLLGCR